MDSEDTDNNSEAEKIKNLIKSVCSIVARHGFSKQEFGQIWSDTG